LTDLGWIGVVVGLVLIVTALIGLVAHKVRPKGRHR
jgi:hypothetical protein